MVLVQNWPFFHLFFLFNLAQENVFYDILKQKNVFLGYKNYKLEKSKNWDFPKGFSPWLWSKIGHFFFVLFLGNLSQENVFCNILERKNAFLCYKNKKLKKSKNWYFSKGVSLWFWSDIGHPTLVRHWPLARSRKIDIFPKGLVYGFGPTLAIFPSSFF